MEGLPYDKTSPKSIEDFAQNLRGKSLRDVLSLDIIKSLEKEKTSNKGELGLMLEKYYFGILPNNRAEPDFLEAGVELKTAGLNKKRDKFTSKEPRLVLSLINYNELHKEQWGKSTFLKKNHLLLLMFYLYEREKLSIDQIFKIIRLWDFPERDLHIIRNDWESIVRKIKEGKAHEISEGDTYYLGACTKGSTAKKSLVNQPFSNKKAKQRAFALKKTYLEIIIAESLLKQADIEPAVKDVAEYKKNKSFEKIIYDRFKPYINMNIESIEKSFRVVVGRKPPKDRYARLARLIMGVKAKRIEEFEKADIMMKTVRLKQDGTPKEDMSFPYFKYMDIVKENWDDSTLKQMFSQKFFFVIFQYDNRNNLIFKKVMFWNMPYDDLEKQVKKVWRKTVAQIKIGQVGNLPKLSENPVCHVRPHAKNSKDRIPTPLNGLQTKKCFWLSKHYLKMQIN